MSRNCSPDLFERHPSNPILTCADIPYPANTVFNAAAAIVDGETLLLLRVEDRSGLSHLTVARSRDGVGGWRMETGPSFAASPHTHVEELWGVEDPRLTWVPEHKQWIFAYTAYSRGGPMVSLAATKDFRRFERLGPVMPPEDKDAALFPVQFGGRWALIHRPMPGVHALGSHIWLSFSPDLKHWGDHKILLHARAGGFWDANKIGLGPPPLLTDRGWLLMYHGVRHTAAGDTYRLGLALLHRDDPRRVLRRASEWVFAPSEPYEHAGDVAGVVFPCGWTVVDGDLRLYYGAADTCIGLATAHLDAVLDWLEEYGAEGTEEK